MAKHKNAATPGGMKVSPTHAEGVSEQEMRAAQYGSARKPQLDAEIETIEINDEMTRREDLPQADEPLEVATVSRGRTVEAPVPGQRRTTGYDNAGQRIYGPVMDRFGPGQSVRLPRSEVIRLRELGFLVDPSKIEPAIQDGGPAKPHIEQEAHQFIRREQR